MTRARVFLLLLVESAFLARAQDAPPSSTPGQIQNPDSAMPSERWNLFYQATSIGQYHGTFNAPYGGPLSLSDQPERDVSLTATLFLGLRLANNTQVFFNPEMAGGRGFSHVSGLANPTNGELPRVASATPKPYLARLYIQQDFGFGKKREAVPSDANQLSGMRAETRYTIVAGRFTVTDFFDNNRYTHDPRTQFMAWGVMYNGAWDYPADTRGYTWGWVHEFHTPRWSLRYASAAEPTVANGPHLDRRIFVDRGDMFEGEVDYSLSGHPGAIRLLNFESHSRSGSYAKAIQVGEQTGSRPDVTAVRVPGTLKYGFGLNLEQELTKNVGMFMRLGWSDGKNEDFAFTAIDRLASAGTSVTGRSWHRPHDTAATSFTASGISGVHATYLAHGGLDFLLGDGRLNYAPEYMWESYYSVPAFKGFFVSLDAQHINNPAFNHDRGPLWAFSLRLHIEGGVPK